MSRALQRRYGRARSSRKSFTVSSYDENLRPVIMGSVTLAPGSPGHVVEAALSQVGVYAPRGLDRLKWGGRGGGAEIYDAHGNLMVVLAPRGR